jgi:hypothetical protein
VHRPIRLQSIALRCVRAAFRPAAGAIALLFLGCYSFSGSTLPGHLRTVQIRPVLNRTLEPDLPERVRRGLEDGFRLRSNLRRVNENGDAELHCTLTDYSHRALTTSGDVVTSYRVDMLAAIVFVDRVKGDTLYRDERVPGYGQYSIERGETEADGQRLALESLVKVVLDNTVSAW